MLVFFRRIRNDIFQRNLQLISIISIIIVIIKKIRNQEIKKHPLSSVWVVTRHPNS
jgi:hypothetical protein